MNNLLELRVSAPGLLLKMLMLELVEKHNWTISEHSLLYITPTIDRGLPGYLLLYPSTLEIRNFYIGIPISTGREVVKINSVEDYHSLLKDLLYVV